MHYFQGSREHRPPPLGGGASTYESQIWCIYFLGIQSVSYCFWVNVTLTFGLSSRKIMSWSNYLIYYLRYVCHICLRLHSGAYCFRVTVTLTFGLSSRKIVSEAYLILFQAWFSNLVCGYILEMQWVTYYFQVTCTVWSLASVLEKSCPEQLYPKLF